MISRCVKEEVELFVVIARRIWYRKNEVVHGGALTHPNQIVREAVAALEDFQRVSRNSGQQDRASENRTVENWKPPQKNMVKINWDATSDTNKRTIGLGIIARDGRGSFMAVETKYLFLNVEPVVVEHWQLSMLYFSAMRKDTRMSSLWEMLCKWSI